MPSVLQLVGSSPDEQARQIQALLVHQFGTGFDVTTRTIGTGGEFRNLPVAVIQLRKFKPDFLYAWGLPALAAAVLAGQRHIFFSPDRFAGPRALRWIRVLMDRSDVTMVCPTFTQQRLAISRGIQPDQCMVIAPGVDFGALGRRGNIALRQELGLSPNDFVLIAPGESTRLSGHELAMWASVIVRQLDARCKFVLWGRGQRADRIAHLSAKLRVPDFMILAERKLGREMRFEELLSIADACLATPTGVTPTLPIATTMAAGVPIIATVNYTLSELLEDRHTALMVPTRSPRALVQRVQDLRSDPALAARIADTARAEAYEHYSMTRMMDQYRQAFDGEGKKANVER